MTVGDVGVLAGGAAEIAAWNVYALPDALSPQATLVATSPLFAQPKLHPGEFKMKPQIDAAIGRGVEFLLNGQLRDGSFGIGNYPVGRTGLRVYALLKSGVRTDHPVMRRALAYLEGARTNKTYSLACAMLAFSTTGEPRHEAHIERMLPILLKAQKEKLGIFGYPHGGDLSNTQYAALGLWVAHKTGLKVPLATWNNLITGTLKHQEEAHYMDVKITTKTGVGKVEVAGFSYRQQDKYAKNKQAVTHTMTTAGVSILKICEICLGKNMRKLDRGRVKRGIELGLNFFDARFTVTKPTPGRWLMYYLYGLERVGALNRVEKFGEHWWYVPGAQYLLKSQKKTGGWGRDMPDTCFALLFLRRATKGGPISGAGGSSATRHAFAAGGSADDIQFRGAGQQPVGLYINSFGKNLLAEHEKYGLRIVRVEYFKGEQRLGLLAGNPAKVWKTDAFLYRCTQLKYGTHIVHARVVAIDPTVAGSGPSKTVTIKSKPMTVLIRDVIEPWMTAVADMQRDNLIRKLGKNLKLTASSNQKTSRLLCDGQDSTSWYTEVADAKPTLIFEFGRLITARRISLTQCLRTPADLKKYDRITAMEYVWGKSKKFRRFEMNSDPLGVTVFEFSKQRRGRKLTLRVAQRGGKADLPVGLAEISLGQKRLPKPTRR